MTHGEKIVGIYHGDCSDGTAAAAVLLKKFPSIKLFPLKHSYEPTDFAPILEAVDMDTTIYTVDNVLGVETLLPLAKEVVSIDHHIGAKEEMEVLAKKSANFTYVFNNDKSGASLAWMHFFGEETTPELVRLIQDFDIWQWKFGDRTKYASRFLIPFVNQPDKLLSFFDADIETLLQNGRAVSDLADYMVETFIARAEPTFLRVGETKVPAFNAQHMFVSEIGRGLSEKLGSAVIMFRIRGERVSMSLRSIEGQSPTALDLATTLGGGGHTHASGAFMPLKRFCEMIVYENHQTQGA